MRLHSVLLCLSLSLCCLGSLAHAAVPISTSFTPSSGPILTVVTVTASPASPQPVNTPITFTATATGGAVVQYQFWLYNASTSPAWSQLQGYSATATCVWTPSVPGNYLLSATAQDTATGTVVNTMLWYTVGNPLSALSVTASPASPQTVGTPVTFTATATGGTNVQYQFWMYNASDSPAWRQLQGYSTTATCLWTPSAPGNYLLSATAQDTATVTVVNTMIWYTVGSPLSALSVTASPASPQPADTPITFTATATGGTNVQYQFWLYNASASPAWSQLQGYFATATCVWTPSTPGNYLLSATAQDTATGAAVNTMIWYTVGSPLSALSVTAAPAAPQPAYTPITFTASATGGTNVQYQFWVYNPNASPAWSQLQGYSTSAACVWIPTTAGDYYLSVTAYDSSSGLSVNQTFWYTITVSLAGTPEPTPSTARPWCGCRGAASLWDLCMTADRPSDGSPTTQQVTLTGYWIYTDEVTVAQYLAFCAATGHVQPTWPGNWIDYNDLNSISWCNSSDWTDPAMQQQPIVDVDWYDAEAYAAWAGVSLPSEAQYEYAARGPEENNYPWGGTATATDPCNGWDQTKCANCWNSYDVCISTWPVGSFPQGASWCGAEDLAGNVWEWCQDWYGDYSSTPVTNPTGPATGSYRVLRGCSWVYGGEDFFRGECRYENDYPNGWYNSFGFRCVAVSPGPLTSVIVTASPVSPQSAYTPITLTASATGGTNVQYQFWVYNSNASPAWSQLQGYSTSATCVWTPTTAGDYYLSITAYDSNSGLSVNQTCWYTITASAVGIPGTNPIDGAAMPVMQEMGVQTRSK